MNNPEEQIYANALNLIPALGPVRINQLFAYFGTFKDSFTASRADYVKAGFNPKLVEQIVEGKNTINPAVEFGKLAKLGIEVIILNSAEYPSILKEIPSAPPLFYIRGNKRALNTSCIGIVGTRKISAYGKAVCSELVSNLVNSRLTIVSGLAFGVDAEALQVATSLSAPTIAVLATPLEDKNISPRSNFNLAQKIMEQGCLVSEYPLGAETYKGNFPVRNRIISGLSVGTLVVEADLDSGSLITANFALEQNREVFAVPGPIFSDVSRGTNNLIKKGAKLVASAADILQELNLDLTPVPEFIVEEEISDAEQIIIDNLTREPIHIDDLTRQLAIPASEVSATLVMLEMKGRVKSLGGAKFAKIR